jgi:hypothetical protein
MYDNPYNHNIFIYSSDISKKITLGLRQRHQKERRKSNIMTSFIIFRTEKMIIQNFTTKKQKKLIPLDRTKPNGNTKRNEEKFN